ncbi:Gfo/Idh/MocA family oxidoreductase [archaeon]|jgi:predicted dehydrogenase|nr:Gfo/Idh/MocA family oxidoreductase [archaeon]NHV06686.1 Gfo/Idh/MocA family oxidoreductase [Nitrososphaerota archaeon]
MTPLKVALLGTGFVANFHMTAFKEIPNAEVVAVASKSQTHAERFAKRWGIRKFYHGDDAIEKAIKDPEVEAVDITLPNYLHSSAVALAAENHKNVIVEKPLARNLVEARQALDAVRRYGVLHAYAENMLFTPHMERAMEMINKGAIGNVILVRSREAHFGPHSAWFWDPELSGGGALIDMGCHSVEVDRKLVRKKPISAFAWGATLYHQTKAEDSSIILVKYEGNEVGQSENSWTAHGGLDIRFEIYGTEGAIFIDLTRETGIKMFTVAPEEKVGYVVEKAEAKKGWLFPIWREHEIYGYLSELSHFVNSFINGKMPVENLEDGYVVNAIIDAGYKSIKSGKWEPVNY